MRDGESARIAEIASRVGHEIGLAGLTLVTGSGVTVGAAAVSGFLNALQQTSSWDLERRLLVRPFSQPIKGTAPNRTQWTTLRTEMARLSGAIVFIGGAALEDDRLVDAEGVLEERELAIKYGVYLLPIGASGGAARTIAQGLIGSPISSTGPRAQRPSDRELRLLLDGQDPGKLSKAVAKILSRLSS